MTTALTPMHPGEFLREEILPNVDLSRVELAVRLKISRQTLHDVINEQQPVTPNIALRLARLLGTTPKFWLAMQAAYDIATLGARLAGEIGAIEPIAVVK